MFESITESQAWFILWGSIILSLVLSLFSKSNNQSKDGNDCSDDPFPVSKPKRSDKVQKKF